jgi:hypothetical protein
MTATEKIKKAFKANENINQVRLAAEIGVSVTYVNRIFRKMRIAKYGDDADKHKSQGGRPRLDGDILNEKQNIPDGDDHDKAKLDYKDNTATLETNSFRIRTAEEACAYANVDMEVWEIERKIINFWDVTMKVKDSTGVEHPEKRTNYQVKIWLRRKVRKNIEEALERLVERIPTFKYSKFTPTHFGSRSGYAGEVAPIDAHLGKLAWALETQQRDYDLQIGIEDYEYAIDQNLEWMGPFNPEKLHYIIGQDMMHTENLEGVTPKGRNILDVDTRFDKLMDATIDISITSVYKCRAVAPVEVILVPGNHDMHASKWLARCIDQHFRKDKHVTVDYGPNIRKARLWGKTLVGWCHEILPSKAAAYANEMAQIFRKEWAQAQYVEWHHGHKHKKGEVKSSPTITHGGVMMRQLTALSPIDFWHYENLFTDAVPGGESFVWHKELGVVANFIAWTNHR